ncbi:metal ABC transporter permease [Thermobifida fusca]|uniref:ABC zinc/manganese transport system permease n=2 Tax=Thermobifida fusca TaxID=2021 RepID=A0A9P2TC85_THEFU|nr:MULTISPECIES: metal ABC transporter permease [Thermobifida]AAZ54895.1 ABC zinc/manganese transport system permease protein [Thermobifida fusca YX]EOR72008.1 ABC zinc/manganese transport system permease [Thermobifida fusca TM51]MBO2529251.1 metal ABC transporter permease [Thermobifida sp.]MDD6792918.1 metal ABC transporter permease [Thermobifida fusca]PPS92710.1 ABC transporter [Thermobifida fusca]
MPEILQLDFMVRAFITSALVGMTAPVIGVFLVQRRLALLGDGIGHVALTGVGLGFLTHTSPVLTALVVSAVGAVLIELVRTHTRTSGDLALALLFYGGIAGGVFLTGLAPGATSADLTSFLFGSVSTVSPQDVVLVALLAVAVLAVLGYFGRELFVLCQDEELARVHGIPVRFLSTVLAVVAAVTVVLAMRVVGVLLVSALMVVPVAAAQQLTRSFRATVRLAVLLGVLAALTGLSTAYYTDTAPGAAIVLVAIALFVTAAGGGILLRRRRFRTVPEAESPPAVGTISGTDPGSVSP